MPTNFGPSLFLGLAAFVLFSPSEASARGIIIISSGDRVETLGPVAKNVTHPYGPCEVGYKYDYFGIFWLSLWTHSGTYCVHEGDKYEPISASEAARLLGKSEKELSKPFWYTIPMGWVVFGPILLLAILGKITSKKGAIPPTPAVEGGKELGPNCSICGSKLDDGHLLAQVCGACQKRAG